MWALSWKNYKLSKLATFISVIGALMRYGAVLCFVNSLIPAGIICLVIGIALHFLAEEVAFNKWKKRVNSNGFSQKIAQGDMQTAISVYNTNPGTKAAKYIASLNTQVGNQIKTMIENNKSKGKKQ